MDWPVTRTGRVALWLAAGAVLIGMFLPVSYWIQMAARSDFLTTLGPYLILAAGSLLILSLPLSVVAIFRFKDKSPWLILIFGFTCLMAAFFAVMLLGEFIGPH